MVNKAKKNKWQETKIYTEIISIVCKLQISENRMLQVKINYNLSHESQIQELGYNHQEEVIKTYHNEKE